MIGRVHLCLTLLFLAFELAFAYRGLNRRGGFKRKSPSGREHEVVVYAVVEPWKTRFRWGGIVQLVLLFAVILLQFY